MPRTPLKVTTSKIGPEHWEEVYNNILLMRAKKDAPVDTMGCERAHDQKASPKVLNSYAIYTALLN